MTSQTYHFKVGDFNCIAINDGYLPVEGAEAVATFFVGAAPDELARAFEQHKLQLDHIDIPCICLLIDTGTHKVLIDNGSGPYFNANLGKLLAGLEAEDITPEQIDVIILSHGHWDHIGGCMNQDGSAIFPNARYVMARSEWQHWAKEVDPASYDGGASTIQFVQANLLSIEKQLDLIEPDVEVLPGITVLAAPGHTRHHVAIAATSGDAQLICLMDSTDSPIHVENPDWYLSWDELPAAVPQTRKKLLQRAVDQNAIIHGFHFPFPGVGHIRQAGSGWRFEPLP